MSVGIFVFNNFSNENIIRSNAALFHITHRGLKMPIKNENLSTMDTVNKQQELSTTDKAGVSFNPLLSAACRRVGDGKLTPKGYEYRGYRIRNHGYYPPDRCVWWEAIDKETGCADFHEHTKRDIIKAIDRALEASCR